MKNFTLITFLFLFPFFGYTQTGFPNYYEFQHFSEMADSLYKEKKFRQSAETYSKAIAVKVEKGITVQKENTHYNAACSWALAGFPDSSFYHIRKSIELGFEDLNYIKNDSDLVSLHSDKNWNLLTAEINNAIIKRERLQNSISERTAFTGDDIIFKPVPEDIRQFIFNDTLPFLSVNHRNFRLYFSGNSYTAKHLPDLKNQLDSAFSRVISILQIKSYHTGINIVLVDSRDELKKITGIAAYGGFALVTKSTVFLVFNDKRKIQAKHELFHLISHDVWGLSLVRVLDEGGGVFADNECFCVDPIYGIDSYLLKKRLLLPFKVVIYDFDKAAFQNDRIAYLQGAGIFKYLYEKYGIEKLKLLRLSGFDQFESIYGFSINEFEKDWLDYISTIPVPDTIDYDRFLKEGCI